MLDKAVALQVAHPDQQVLPVLICRKAHKTAYWMASQLGFMVIDTGIQYTGPVEEAALLEVRNELHFQDLHAGAGPAARVIDRFRTTVPNHAVRLASVWKTTCLDTARAQLIGRLRYERNNNDRAELLSELRSSGPWRGGW